MTITQLKPSPTRSQLTPSPVRVTIHQPNLFPRHKVIQKLAAADIWIVLDDVQFAKREWQNRCMIVPDHGAHTQHWLTLPVRLPRGQASWINEVELVDTTQTLAAARNSIVNAYRHSPGWESAQRTVLSALESDDASLTQVCVQSTIALLACAGAAPTVYYASELALPPGDPSDRIAALTEMVGGSEYLCDSGGANYLTLDSFDSTRHRREMAELARALTGIRRLHAVAKRLGLEPVDA